MFFGIMFSVITALVLGVFAFVIAKSVTQWHKNNNSPRLSVVATVVSRRTSVSHMAHTTGDSTFMSPSTTYYVTFQVESGDRMELCVNGREYGMLCEGDSGRLTFQGTRYINFDRDRSF